MVEPVTRPLLPGTESFEIGKLAFASHPVLGRLDPDARDLVAGMSHEIRFRRGQELFGPADPPPGLILVRSGFVTLGRHDSEDRELLMSLAGPQDLLGSCCQPLLPRPNPCRARARSHGEGLLIPTASWQWLLSHRPAVAHVILEALLQTRGACTDRASDLALCSARERLARLILDLCRWSRPGPEGALELPSILSQREIASAIGTAREVVTRKIHDLVDRGILGRQGRRILVRDPQALRGLLRSRHDRAMFSPVW